MIYETETRSHIAQHWAAREAEYHTANRERLEDWARRYPYDLVEIPPAVQPPKWPAQLCSRAISNVTPLRKGKRG